MAEVKLLKYAVGTGVREHQTTDDITFAGLTAGSDGLTTSGAFTVTGTATTDFTSTGAITATGNPTWNLGTGAVTAGGDVVVSGNLTVSGTTITVESETVRIADNHIFLNDGYTSETAQTGGLVVNYDPDNTSNTNVDTGGFVAGVNAVSNPTVRVTSVAGLAANDFILIEGAADETNNGLFEVSAINAGTTPDTLTIRGVGTVGEIEDFTQNQFATDTTVQGTVTKIAISVLRSGTDGAWEVADDDNHAGSGLTFADLGTATGSTLQAAYTAGNTITTDSTNGAFDVSGTQIISLDATGNSNFTVASGDLDLVTTTTGAISIDSITGITIDAQGATSFTNIDAGTDTSATGTRVRNDSGTTLFEVLGSGAIDASDGTLDVPAGTSFLINGSALTTANWTGANVDTLLDGSNADSLHIHDTSEVLVTMTAGAGGVDAGESVYVSAADTVLKADASAIATGRFFGVVVANILAAASGDIKVAGIATSVSGGGTFTSGTPVYVSLTAGDHTQTAPSSAGEVVSEVGIATGISAYLIQPKAPIVNS